MEKKQETWYPREGNRDKTDIRTVVITVIIGLANLDLLILDRTYSGVQEQRIGISEEILFPQDNNKVRRKVMNHLNEQEAKEVINMLSELFSFAYKKKHGKLIIAEDFNAYLTEGANILFQDEVSSKKLITEYLTKNKVSKKTRETMRRWMGARKHNLFFIGENEERAIMYDDEEKKVYGIKGITDSMGYMLMRRDPPILVNYAILPYRNFYIADSMGRAFPFHDLNKSIEIYEAYRNASLHQPMEVAKGRYEDIIHIERTLTDDYADVFLDYANPLLLFGKTDKELTKELVEISRKAWNAAVDEEIPENLTEKEKRYLRPMIKRKMTTFAQYDYLLEECNIDVRVRHIP